MATKPQFAPGQDMSDVSPEDVIEAKKRAKDTKAYDKAMPEADTTTGKLKGESVMDKIEKYNPGAKESIDVGVQNTRRYGDAAAEEFKKGNYGTAAKEVIKGIGSTAKTMYIDVPVEAARAGMNRLKYGPKMASGGSVSSASKRADGIAQRGKTRGTIVMCGGGMAKRK